MKINLNGNNDEISGWIWDNLIPTSGQSETVQGELLRAIEKLRWEAQENGNINWDRGFEIHLEFIFSHLCNEVSFSEETAQSIEKDLDRLNDFMFPEELESREDDDKLPYVDDDLYDRLVGHLVGYCRKNQILIKNKNNPEQHR